MLLPCLKSGQCLFAPVMGDILGDGTMQVVAADLGGYIHAWTWDGLPLPAIAHWKEHHYVVLYKVGGKAVVVADPAVGLIKMSRKE